MLIRPTKFKVAMLTHKGDAAQYQERTGYSFAIAANGAPYRIALHKCGNGWIATDFRTGLKISHEHTPCHKEAAQRLADMFKVGAYQVEKLRELTRDTPTANREEYA